MDDRIIDLVDALDAAADLAFGTQSVQLSDPWDSDTCKIYAKPGDLCARELRMVMSMYSGSHHFCRQESLCRLIPEALLAWIDCLLPDECVQVEKWRERIGWLDDVSDMYAYLDTHKFFRGLLPLQMVSAIEQIMSSVLLNYQHNWWRQQRAIDACGGKNDVILHFNSLAGLLPRMDGYWQKWWLLDHPCDLLQALWFMSCFGSSEDQKTGIVRDTRWLSGSLLSSAIGGEFWTSEFREGLLKGHDWGAVRVLIDGAVLRHEEDLRAIGAEAVRALAGTLRPEDELFQARFREYVERMATRNIGWSAWQQMGL